MVSDQIMLIGTVVFWVQSDTFCAWYYVYQTHFCVKLCTECFFEYFELMPKHLFVNGITVLRFTHTLFLFQFCSQLFYARSPFLLRFCPLLSYFLPPFAPHHSPHLFPASFAPRFLLNSLLWGEAGLQMA